MLIDSTYFVGEIGIANATLQAVSTNLSVFITKYETKFLKLLLGDTLYADFTAGLLIDPIAEEWVTLRDLLVNSTTKESAIANYIYYRYMLNEASKTVGVGQVKPTAENAAQVNNMPKMVRAWNEMVDWNRVLSVTLSADYEAYDPPSPYWGGSYCYWCYYPEILTYKNMLDL